MVNVTARIKLKGKHYEIMVNLDEALKFKQGKGDIISALDSDAIYYDLKKGTKASNSDLTEAFGTTDFYEAAKQIITKGEVQKTQDFRDQERENKIKQVINLILKNAVDQHGRPYTEERLKRAIDEAHYSFDSKPAEQQMPLLVEKLKTIIPIKIETKKIKLVIPAQYTGQVYGLLKDFKESEDWLANGNLQAILNIPAGMQLDFYDKLNHITHGAVQSEEIKEAK
jgi:ribosome maturation protein SDO1